MADENKFVKEKEINLIPKEELFAQGHRACAGCGVSLAARYALKAAGKNTIVVNATGCLEVFSTPYPESAWEIPWIHGAFENAASIASGVAAAIKKSKQKTNLLVFGGDGGTFDIGFQALSGAIERGHKFCYICVDNEAYMNTGIQRSGSTEKYASTTTTPAGKVVHGKQEFKKEMPFIIAGHNENVYVATASVAFPQDFINKVKKALTHNGPSYIQIFSSCPTGWKSLGNFSVEIAKQAVLTRVVPLFEIEKGKLTLNRRIDTPNKIQDYLMHQGRFKHLNEKEIKELQDHINEKYERIVKIAESGLKVW